MAETVKVYIDTKTQTTKYEINGVLGESCDEITKALIESNEVLEHEYTSEYSEQSERPDYVEDME